MELRDDEDLDSAEGDEAEGGLGGPLFTGGARGGDSHRCSATTLLGEVVDKEASSSTGRVDRVDGRGGGSLPSAFSIFRSAKA